MMPADDPSTPGTSHRIARLSDADANAIDRLFEHGLDDGSSGDSRENAALDLMSILESYPVEPASEELVDATIARVAREEEARASRFSFGNALEPVGRKIRIPDFFAAAAALFLAVGIGWPLYQMIDRQNGILHSEARLKEYGAGIISFANENQGSLPLHEGMIAESGHTMNDLPGAMAGDYGLQLQQRLADDGHLGPAFMDAERIRLTKISPVSFRIPLSRQTFKLTNYDGSEPMLADANPVIWSKRHQLPPLSHRGGSHVHQQKFLVVMRFDLSSENLPSAILPDGDSLWVHHGYEPSDSNAKICPADLEDAVLAH